MTLSVLSEHIFVEMQGGRKHRMIALGCTTASFELLLDLVFDQRFSPEVGNIKMTRV